MSKANGVVSSDDEDGDSSSVEDEDTSPSVNHDKEQEVKYTFWLVFSIIICVFGNSFLFGYNIGVVNSPAEIIKVFYAKVHLARNGIETTHKKIEGEYKLYVAQDVADDGRKEVFGGNTTGTTGSTSAVSTTIENVTVSDPSLAHVDDNLLDLMWSVTVAIFVLFGMVGSLVSGRIASRFGRKLGMIGITVIMFVAAIFGGIAKLVNSPECLIVSRAFTGLHNGIGINLATLYLAEISPKKIRGAIGTCHQLAVTIGILWSMIMGLPDMAGAWSVWPVCFAFNAIPALTCLVLFPRCPESPRFLLIEKKDEDGAKKALRKFRGYSHTDEDNELVYEKIKEMKAELRKEALVKPMTLKQLLTTPELKRPIMIAVVCQVAQQWSGINAAMSYSVFIFKQADVPETAIPYVIVVQGLINVIATIVAVPLMDKAGRRPLLLYPMCVMVVSFIVLTVCLNLLKNPDLEASKLTLAIVCIIAVLIYIIGFAIGLGPIPFIVVSELFQQDARAAAMSFSLAFNWICNFILVLTFRFIQKGLEEYTYIIFTVILIASILVIFYFVPETKGRSLDNAVPSTDFKRRRLRKMIRNLIYEDNGEEMKPMKSSS